MVNMPDKLIIEGPNDWRGPEMQKRTDWIHSFDDKEVAEIEAALKHVHDKGLKIEDIQSAADFPLDLVARRLEHARDYIENGPGIFHFHGLPTDRLSKDDLRLTWWGLGRNFGTPVSQSDQGDLLGDVRNIMGNTAGTLRARGYNSNMKLSYHTDSADVVGLMVMRVAKSGGKSMLCSSVAVHNEIARTRPDLLEVLYTPFPWSWQGQEAPGDAPFYMQPVFSYHDGKFSCRYIRVHIMSSQRFDDAPRLSEKQIEALDYLDSLSNSPEFHFGMMFAPGDIQLVNNHVCFHSRTEFDDYEEMDQRRHLLRLWLSVPNSRNLSPLMGTIYQNQKGGTVRGGFPSRTGRYAYETARPPGD